MKKRPIILKIMLGGYEEEEECPKCGMPEDECECEEESGDEEEDED